MISSVTHFVFSSIWTCLPTQVTFVSVIYFFQNFLEYWILVLHPLIPTSFPLSGSPFSLWHFVFFESSTCLYWLTLLSIVLSIVLVVWSYSRLDPGLPIQSYSHHFTYLVLTPLLGLPWVQVIHAMSFQMCFKAICSTANYMLSWDCLSISQQFSFLVVQLFKMKTQNSPWFLLKMVPRTSRVHPHWLHSLAIPLECK